MVTGGPLLWPAPFTRGLGPSAALRRPWEGHRDSADPRTPEANH